MKELSKSKDLQNKVIDAVENLKFDVQYAIQAAMKSKNVSQKELAQLMECSASNISQMLAADSNPNVATIAKALAVLSEDFAFASETLNGKLILAEIKNRGDSLDQFEAMQRMSWVNQLVKEWGQAMNDVEPNIAPSSARAKKVNRVSGLGKATMWTGPATVQVHAEYEDAA